MKRFYNAILWLVMLAFIMTMAPVGLAENGKPDERVRELTERRTADSKTYLLENGQLQTVLYAGNVHYLNKQGKYEDISNRIIRCETNRSSGVYSYQSEANRFLVRFAEDVTKNPVRIEYEDYALSMQMVGAQAASGKTHNKESLSYETLIDGLIALENSMVYQNVKPGIDLVYEVYDNGVKELIVINELAESNQFIFNISTEGLEYYSENGYIFFKDNSAASGTLSAKPIFMMGGLFAFDAAGAFTDKIKMSVISGRGTDLKIDITIDETFLNSPDRVYPIVIDPSVMVTGENNTFDSHVRSISPSANFQMTQDLWIGSSTAYGTNRTFIKFNLPTNLATCNITEAELRLKNKTGSSTNMWAYRVTSNWSSGSITWNNKPSSSSSNIISSYEYGNSWYAFSVTSMVRDWVEGVNTNYGFEIRSKSEGASASITTFYSSDAPSPNKPELVITYLSSYYGSRPYEQSSSASQNCMGYALDVMQYIDSDELEIEERDLNGMSISEVEEYYIDKCITWMNENLNSVSWALIGSASSSIGLDQYRVATRVDFNDINGNGIFNYMPNNPDDDYQDEENPHDSLSYHWLYQTDQGLWADKMTTNPSTLRPSGFDPETSSWISGDTNTQYYRKSNVIYFRVDAN
ncbi:MAG: DNRLRE domain-containing protein [Clostridia bacterium]|nr:DNRLRE domain-containing protein [Clostridia bacterium]